MVDKSDDTSPSSADQTVYRDDFTVMRNDPSVTSTTASQSSWRSGIQAGAGGADAPKVLKQRFVLEELIGSGGMGSVFRAKDLRKVEARGSQPYLAVKVLNNDFRHHPEAFVALEREATKSQGLRHSNIVSIFDFDKDEDVPFITMELLEGEELADLLKTYPSGVPEELAWRIIDGMVRGLGHAHNEGVVHADFKPGNIYITERQDAKILDFGIARAMRLNSGGEDTDFDPSRLAALTPAYASREMLNGDNPEPRDDLYSLGVVIYMVLTGHHPYGRLPAHEAAKEGLVPERIKQLSRRRWRVIEQCLNFNRQDRPDSAEEVYEALFGKVAWKSWSFAATAALVAISLGLVAFKDNTTINEVKEEVRQETLVDAQMTRINALLDDPKFDTAWERLLFSELQTLRTLSPGQESSANVTARIESLYATHVTAIESLDVAFRQFQSGRKFGPLLAAKDNMADRLIDNIDRLTEQPVDSSWLAEAEQTLSYVMRFYPRNGHLAAARLDLISHMQDEVPRLLREDQVLVAEQIWNTFSEEVFDEESAESTGSSLLAEVNANQAREAARSAERQASYLREEMAKLLEVSCLRLDIGMVAGELTTLGRQHPTHKAALKKQVGERVSACVQRLGALDPDRAMSLQKEAQHQFGDIRAVKTAGVDPCSLHYLVGNGQVAGRGGSCADEIAAHDRGPRLVVIPGDEALPKFAISKYEISWRDLNAFCAASNQCVPAQNEDLPVTGVSVDVIEAYAKWLSEKTGYRYRLPTQVEWQQVAQGKPDPNRNCRVDAGGVRRGDTMLATESGAANSLGLVHVLGNAQELVKTDEAYIAVGGTYSDPIDACLASSKRSIESSGDEATGFRLVREVS